MVAGNIIFSKDLIAFGSGLLIAWYKGLVLGYDDAGFVVGDLNGIRT